MAHGRPWYKRNPTDFIMGTVGMDLETRGAYSLLIDLLNERDRPIADDARLLAGYLGVSTRKWTAIREKLLADPSKLYVNDDGRLTNPRFERERAERRREHDEAVKHGSEGGRRSAELRAAQGRLDLADDDGTELAPVRAGARAHRERENGAKTARKSRENAPKNGRTVEAQDDAGLKSNDKIQAPPQAPCAREESRDKSQTQHNPSDSTPRVEADDGSGRAAEDPVPRLRDADLGQLYEAICEASGFATSYPNAIDRAFKQVEAWRNDGIDFDAIVLPVIRRTVSDSSDPTRTLGRFDKAVRHEHARAKALNGSGRAHVPPASPVLEPPGEDPAFRPMRVALLAALGPQRYATYANSVRFEAVAHASRGRPVRILDNKAPSLRLYDGDRIQLVRRLVEEQGFTDVW